MQNKLTILIFTGILLLAAFFRLYGVNWDQDQHLHPDERFLTMVATGIEWPKNLWEYLDTDTSPLNPHNRGFGFFVYGTFPVFFTKWVAETLGKGDYNQLTIVGRQLSALFDLGTVILVFLIGKQISNFKFLISNQISKPKSQLGQLEIRSIRYFPHLAMFFYSVSVLPIQLSHFFAVDTYLTFFITLSLYILVKIITLPAESLNTKYSLNIKYYILYTLLSISFGLALASKISALLFLPIICLGFIHYLLKSKNYLLFPVYCLLFIVFCYLTVRLTQPYLFPNSTFFSIKLNAKLISNWKELKSFDDPGGGFPPGVQWITTKAYLFPLKNLVFWGLGLPLGSLSILAILYMVFSILYSISKRKLSQILNTKFLPAQVGFILSLSLFWTLLLFIYQGGQFAKNMRYFIPVYPFLAILSALLINVIMQKIQKNNIKLLAYLFIGLLVIIYPLSFMSIYRQPHSRVAASYWIYDNISPGSYLAMEHWDDGLPLSLPQPGLIHEKYISVEFPLYGSDTPEKWSDMINRLKKVDYIMLTSNRLYGSIMTIPEKYPVTFRYYQALFDRSLGFAKVAEFTSRPNLPIPALKLCLTPPFIRYGIVALKSQECPLPGISFVDDYADESFTVYDHPKVLIFKKIFLNNQLLNQYYQESQKNK